MSARYMTDGEGDESTTWPDPWGVTDEFGVENRLRYGPHRDLFAASCVGAYAALVDPNITQTEAVEKLKRARRAMKRLTGETA